MIIFLPSHLRAQSSFRLVCEPEFYEKLKNYLQAESLSNFFYNSDSLYKRIDQFFFQEGFLDYKIISEKFVENSDTISLIQIFEGQKYLINSIHINDSLISNNEINQFNARIKGSVFSPSTIQSIKLKLAEHYELKGYPFAEVTLDGFEIKKEESKEKFIEVFFSVEKNLKAKIDKVEIAGNNFTKENVIIRELNIKENDYFNPKLSQKLITRLQRLNIFSNIKNPEFYFDEKNKGNLRIEVVEDNTNSFDGLIGYIPSSERDRKGYLTGQVNFSFRNLFGTLRAFSFRWNRIDRFSQDLEIKYFEPWFFNLPLNILPSFQQTKQDTSFIRRNFNSQFDLNLLENFSIVLSISFSSVIPQSQYYINNVFNSTSTGYGVGIKIDTRDHPFFTKSGLLFRTDFYQVIKKIHDKTQTSRYNQKKGHFNFQIFQQVIKNQILFASFNAKVIDGGKIEISDLFYLGGMNTVRGYEENQFRGSRVFWSNIEYRLFVSYTDYVALFFDSGYYFRDILDEKLSKFRIGYGFGIGFNMPLGLMKVSYALGEGDSFLRGKIHFGIVSAF